MTCQEIRSFLGAQADGELDLVRSLEIERHLRDCPACARTYGAIQELRMAVKTRLPYYRAPAELMWRVQAAVAEAGREASRPTAARTSWRLWSMALAAAIVLVFGLAWLILPLRRQQPDLLAQEVVASHIRSLMAGHLVDVPSSDQHTVKPWFQGRLDYAPPVPDLSRSGFTLVGGRLDYVAGHPVAALVYRYRGHTLNLFLWPPPAGSPGSEQSLTRDGYSVAHWNWSGMTCWAVTDADSTVLRAFVKEFQEHAAPTTAS